MADLLEEVLSDHQDEKKLYYFRKLLPVVVVITACIVVGMIVYNWRSAKQDHYNTLIGDILLKAMSVAETDQDSAFSSLSGLVKQGKTHAVEIALLEKIGIKLKSKDYTSVKTITDEIINNKKFYHITKSYAKIIWLSLVIDQQVISAEEGKTVTNYLNSFSNENQEFFGTASLIKAFWYLKQNQRDLAKEVLKTTIALNNVTLVVKDQATALLSSLEQEIISK